MRTARALVATLATACLGLTSCGSQDSGTQANAVPTQGVSGNPGTWPLTGLPVSGSSSSVLRHPVLVLKMDNTSSSSPQEGLSSADLVVEEMVEGGVTRLAAFYYSSIPQQVGPVRSMRASDIGIVSPVGASVVTSGAAPVTIGRIQKAGIHFYGEGTSGFFRDSGRRAPYNLFTNLSDVAKAAKQRPGRPLDYLPWGSEGHLAGGGPATSISAAFSRGHATVWSYHDGLYVNENTNAGAGDEFPADTVLVLRVQVGDAGYRDPAGNPVPETKLVGKGEAMLFHGGDFVRATWSKDHLDAPIELSTKDGKLAVPAGHTWIELVPAASGAVTYSK